MRLAQTPPQAANLRSYAPRFKLRVVQVFRGLDNVFHFPIEGFRSLLQTLRAQLFPGLRTRAVALLRIGISRRINASTHRRSARASRGISRARRRGGAPSHAHERAAGERAG